MRKYKNKINNEQIGKTVISLDNLKVNKGDLWKNNLFYDRNAYPTKLYIYQKQNDIR